MPSIGLITRDDLKRASNNRPKLKLETSPERYRELGLKGVRSMNPAAITPEMAPSGVKRPLVYILGEAPGEQEDRDGEPFVGAAGQCLRGHLPRGYERLVRINNCVRTRPPDNRQPTTVEIECFRESICQDIEAAKPKAILGVGQVPLIWAIGYDAPKISFARGRRFPVRFGKHSCWFYPTYHPSYISRVRDSRELVDDIPGAQYETVFQFDIERCFEEANSSPPPSLLSPKRFLADLYEGIECLEGSAGQFQLLKQFIHPLISHGYFFYIDLETSCIRPYEAGAKILSASITQVSTGETISFALDHPENRWGKYLLDVHKLFAQLLYSKTPRGAHNAPFEVEWTTLKYGHKILTGGKWHCTAAQAYVLDNRTGKHKGEGTQNLNFCCQENLGVRIKDFSNLDRKRLEHEPLDKVLKYNGLDTKYGAKLWQVQRQRIKEAGLSKCYTRQQERIAPFAFAQVQGLPPRKEAVKRLQTKLAGRLKRVEAKIKNQAIVKKFIKRFGSFNPASNDNLVRLYRDMLGRREGARGNSYSTDEEALKAMDDVPMSKLILQMRSANKLKGTYVDPLDPAQRKTVVYPDGLLHCQMNPTKTDTGRSSIEGPSLQNFPVRDHPWIRKVIGPVGDLRMLSFDFGAIQARCIAMESGDKNLIKSFWTDYDIHQEWAEKVAKISNKSYREVGRSDMKHFRNMIKNKLVFPAFFNSSEGSITRDLLITDSQGHAIFEEFWDLFPDVKNWHKECMKFYLANMYIESLSGRRRVGPMSKAMVVNSPIQADEGDIVSHAMDRILIRALETDRPWLAARLNVHDDLTFIIPKSKFDEAVCEIVPIMCDRPFKWMNVPILIEGSLGKDWYMVKKSPFAKFTTQKLDEQLLPYRKQQLIAGIS